MYTTLDCIALRTVRYNDRKDILSAYSRQAGRISFVISAGRGREATRRRALLMPMSRFGCVCDMRPGRDLYTMGEVRTLGAPAIDSDPLRGMTALFIGDLLHSVLTEPVGDPALYDFITLSAGVLSTISHRQIANYHITFMVRLMHYLGIMPDRGTYRPGYVFDITGGVFRPMPPLSGTYLERDDARYAATLLRITYRNMHRYVMSHSHRNTIVDHLIEYYTTHHRSMPGLKSLEVLRNMF